MVKRVNRLDDLGKLITEGTPLEVIYDLGQGKDRTELLVTHLREDTYLTNRISSSPRIRLYQGKNGTLMDFEDSNMDADSYSYKALTPQKAIYSAPEHFPHDRGDLEIPLGNGRTLGISQYERESP